MNLKTRIAEDMKNALRSRESARLSAIRLLVAAVKQREIDERIELDDAGVLMVVDKLLKQRRDSIAQYEAAGRTDLAQAERFEAGILSAYLPPGLSESELQTAVAEAVAAVGAKGPADMGKVMAALKSRLAGRADMAKVSALVKAVLTP